MERRCNNEAAEPDAYTRSERRKQQHEEETSNKQKGARLSQRFGPGGSQRKPPAAGQVLQTHRPVQLCALDEQGQIILHAEALKILEDDKLKDKKVCVVSISGEFRKGKSFILNFFIRFLQLTKNKTCSENWLDDQTEPMEGFLWKASSELQTKGIVMWSEIFLIKLNDSNEEVAVILLDTQGCYDNKTGMVEMSSIFSLTTLFSSVQIYNVQENLNLNHFQTFHVFMEYARLLLYNNQEKPFQKLLILIRDWCNEHEFAHGSEKGQDYLNFVFQQHEQAQEKELKAIKSDIYSCFEKVDCFLMSHPGLRVTKNAYTGNVQDIEERLFVEHVKKLVVEVFDPRNLSLKKIGKGYATCSEFVELIRNYWLLFKNGKQPKLQSIYSANSTVCLIHLISQLQKEFEGGVLKCESDENVQKFQTKYIKKYDEVHKMGDDELIKEYRQKFIENISNAITIYKISRRLLEEFKTEVLKCNSEDDLRGQKETFHNKSNEEYIMADNNFIQKCREKNAKAVSNYSEICSEKIILQDEFKRLILECESNEDVNKLQAEFHRTFEQPRVMEDNGIPTSSQQDVQVVSKIFNQAAKTIGLKKKPKANVKRPNVPKFDEAVKEVDNDWNQKCLQTFKDTISTVVSDWKNVLKLEDKFKNEVLTCKCDEDVEKLKRKYSTILKEESITENQDWIQQCQHKFGQDISTVISIWKEGQRIVEGFKREVPKCKNRDQAENLRREIVEMFSGMKFKDKKFVQEYQKELQKIMEEIAEKEFSFCKRHCTVS